MIVYSNNYQQDIIWYPRRRDGVVGRFPEDSNSIDKNKMNIRRNIEHMHESVI
jgi:hypothetical protein